MRVNDDEHVYISTACLHEEHGRCRRTCKFCAALCQCECHAMGEELSARESDWVFWPPPGETVDTGGKCTCGGHDGLGPSWHTHDCPAVVYLWHNRAKELHDRLWDLWERVCRGEPIDVSNPDDCP